MLIICFRIEIKLLGVAMGLELINSEFHVVWHKPVVNLSLIRHWAVITTRPGLLAHHRASLASLSGVCWQRHVSVYIYMCLNNLPRVVTDRAVLCPSVCWSYSLLKWLAWFNVTRSMRSDAGVWTSTVVIPNCLCRDLTTQKVSTSASWWCLRVFLSEKSRASISECIRLVRYSLAYLDISFSNTAFSKRTFRCSAPATWNSLPRTVTDSDSLGTFKSNMKTFLFCQAFS